MFGSDKDQPTAYRLIVSLVILAAVVSPFVIFGLYEEARYKEISSYRTGHYAQDANEAVKNTCIGSAGRDKAVCLHEKGAEARLQKHDNERNEADLVAQRKSALWTSIMGFAALIGMGLSAIGVYLVWTTFRETQRGNEITRQLNAPHLTWHVSATLGTNAEQRDRLEVYAYPTNHMTSRALRVHVPHCFCTIGDLHRAAMEPESNNTVKDQAGGPLDASGFYLRGLPAGLTDETLSIEVEFRYSDVFGVTYVLNETHSGVLRVDAGRFDEIGGEPLTSNLERRSAKQRYESPS